jgi:hypothetical protein
MESNAVIEPRSLGPSIDSLSEGNATITMSSSPLATASNLNFVTTVSVSPVALELTPPGQAIASGSNSPINLAEEDRKKEEEMPIAERSTEGRLDSLGGSTFDYLYEFSETRKVLEEFFKCPTPAEEESSDVFQFQVRSAILFTSRPSKLLNLFNCFICLFIHKLCRYLSIHAYFNETYSLKFLIKFQI